ncbi:MAG: sulfotransferase [Chthoniobacterales bacterium]
MPLRINLSSRAEKLSGGGVLVISNPNSGRTWIRTFLAAYFCGRYGHPFSLDPDQYGDARIPRVIYTHDLYEYYTKGRWWDRMRSKYLVPRREVARARILLLVRDPRDAFVSHYLELTRRTAETAETVKKQTAGETLRDPVHGIDLMIRTMNAWLAEFGRRGDFMLVRYEDLHAAPEVQFRRILTGAGEPQVDERAFAEALQFSQFGNMKKMEASRQYDAQLLQPGDVNDPESYKVRRGKVGGHADYLEPPEMEYASRALARLDARFGYSS